MRFPSINRIVVFESLLTKKLPPFYLHLISAAIDLQVPIFDAPHGLFNFGNNIHDDFNISLGISDDFGVGDFLIKPYSNKLRWYGDEAIGYPRTSKKRNEKAVYPDFTLVTSNTNWFLYSPEDQVRFYKAIKDYAECYSDELIIWSPHPAEIMRDEFTKTLMKIMPENLLVYGEEFDIYFYGVDESSSLIECCRKGISTVSTCLLDFELYEKSVSVFSNDGLNDILNKFENVNVFRNFEDMKNNFGKIKTGYLQEYSFENFDRIVAQGKCLTSKNYVKNLLQ